MAEVESLGLHRPAALSYLISEGILPKDPAQNSYQWETYGKQEADGHVEEEVLATEHCVVWSQGRYVRRVYRFELEGEKVVQAILTRFPAVSRHSSGISTRVGSNGHELKPGATEVPQFGPDSANERTVDHDRGSSSTDRALVVFLRSKAHIYFLQGSNYVIDLPIEVDRVFPAPRGIIVQRKPSAAESTQATPHVPAPPPNSFLSSQPHLSSSYLESPSIARSLGRVQPSKPGQLNDNSRLDALLRNPLGLLGEVEENVAPLYSLTDPLGEFGVLTYSIQHPKPRISARGQPGLSVDFETLDATEELIYVSAEDELSNEKTEEHGSLTLIVTVNAELQTTTIWHAWYIEEKSLAALMRQRTAHKAAKARRRSSFLSAGMATGTTTPVVRHREGTRESFAAAGSLRQPGEPAASQLAGTSSRKPTRQEEEDAMASQMDPDYQPTASQQTARESRRISSLNTDVRASQSAVNASFGGPAGRRNASFGGVSERRSFSHRKSRGSTPGSTFSRSQGPDDDLMDVDSSLDADGQESVDSILRHIRATYEAAGADSLFGGNEGDFRRDLVVRKLHSLAISSTPSMTSRLANTMRVATLRDPLALQDGDAQQLNIYVHDASSKNVTSLTLWVSQHSLWSSDSSPYVAIPKVRNEFRLGQCTGTFKLQSSSVEAVLLADRGIVFAGDGKTISPLPKEIAMNRQNVAFSSAIYSPLNPGAHGEFDAVPNLDILRRRQAKLRPEDRVINELLDLCQFVLPQQEACKISSLWCAAHDSIAALPGSTSGTTFNTEWIAFGAVVFSFIAYLIDDGNGVIPALSALVAGHELKQQLPLRHSPWSLLNRQPAESANKRLNRQDDFPTVALALAVELQTSNREASHPSARCSVQLMLALHIYREEQKLSTLRHNSRPSRVLAVIIAQLGEWLTLEAWGFRSGLYHALEGAAEPRWTFVKRSHYREPPQMPLMEEPVGVFQWFEHSLTTHSGERYPTVDVLAGLARSQHMSKEFKQRAKSLTPRITILSDMFEATSGFTVDSVTTLELTTKHGVTIDLIEALPVAIAAPFKEAIARCERQPPTTWPSSLLGLVGRDDLDITAAAGGESSASTRHVASSVLKDIQAICNTLDHHAHHGKTKEARRHAVSQLIFNEDRRLIEATSLMHFNSVQVAECPKQPDWTDAFHLEQQRKIMQWVTIRMIALPTGDAMIHYDSQTPLLTDKYHLPGFSNACLMQPMGHTLTTDRSGLTEEKVNWAYFHAGVSVGLRISKSITGIDTSWIAFNKPAELTNRHAGLLLALGLGGHLKHVAKWLSFKYLTPKHSMTSVGLLLGLSASYMGTMDGLITRMLSVHITRMLPPGAAELNVSPVTQTAGLMGIGLLYYNTQHRRMSEIMLSEVEHMELEDPDSGPDPLRDESYRLAAGFSLGYINLGKGKDLRGLHGMQLPERLLAVAVGPRPVNAVHVFDRATAGAVTAIALVYMKSGNKAIARKINIPDTEAQFDHVRPDILMLRAMAHHLIMWDDIETEEGPRGIPRWISANVPKCYASRFQEIHAGGGRHPLRSSDIPFFNIVTGLAWVLSLKYAGSGDVHARDEVLSVLQIFYMVQGSTGGYSSYNYDNKLTRSTVRRCIDVLSLAAATVMAGTGDLKTFRFLRRLHGRTDPDTPYGSHLAAHLAIGILFLGGGTYTFGTSDLAVASLICAFYPLWPTDVHDNHVHLQALRHLWVFAAEARCLVVEDVDTQKPISTPINVTLTNGTTKALTTPCLLPELDKVASVHTNDPSYWRVVLDFANNPQHFSAFKAKQRIQVHRCPASEAHTTIFSTTFAALNDVPPTTPQASLGGEVWQSIFNLGVFKDLNRADLELILPLNVNSSIYTNHHGTVVDDRLQLIQDLRGLDRDKLWNLRLLFAWAERAREEGEGRLKWIGGDIVETLKAGIDERRRTA